MAQFRSSHVEVRRSVAFGAVHRLRRARRAVVAGAALAFVLVVAAAPSAWAVPDFDGDGSIANDCEPLDPAIGPRVLDKPDVGFEDTNCDGLDGDASRAVFVAPSGNDLAAGTRAFPKRTIRAALVTAVVQNGKDIYVASGTYDESVTVVDGVGIYGGYAAGTWARSHGELTTIAGAPQAILVDGDQGVVLQLLALRGEADASGSAHALRAINGAGVALRQVTAIATDAAAGRGGATPGSPQAAGGANGGDGGCNAGGAVGAGGPGTHSGGEGGAAAYAWPLGNAGTAGAGPFGGVPGSGGGNWGQPGLAGSPGGAGRPGTVGHQADFTMTAAKETWIGADGASGATGEPGSGGGGGGGGSSGRKLVQLTIRYSGGGGGGGGGAGGAGGPGGAGGASGGGSFGAYLEDSAVVAVDSLLQASSGGPGGNGALGAEGTGGTGGSGGGGGSCNGAIAGDGGQGGAGGAGGRGGGGGGGAGGPSAAVFRTGSGSAYASRGSSERPGGAGVGGLQAGTTERAAPGQAAGIMRAPSAPEIGTADFDRDGIVDASDGCPEIPRQNDATGDGCPDRPPRLTDSDGDGFPDVADRCPDTPRGNDADEDGCPDPPTIVTVPSPRPINVSVSYVYRATARYTVLTRLQLRRIPAGARVQVRCNGRRCPVKKLVRKRASGRLSLKPFTRKRLPVGTVLRIKVTREGMVGSVKILRIRAGKAPSARTLCLPLGTKTPLKC